MARKTESTSEQIVRLYKEGNSFDEIAKSIGMPVSNVPKILEKHMPNYKDYTPSKAAEEESKKNKGGLGFLKKKQKNNGVSAAAKETAPVTKESKSKSKANDRPTVNLKMDEKGFIDKQATGIAGMLKSGRDVAAIVEFLNCSESDVEAVRECMNEHFKRVNDVEKVTQVEPKNVELKNLYSTNGLEKISPEVKKDDASDEMPSLDLTSLDLDALGGKPVEYKDSDDDDTPLSETLSSMLSLENNKPADSNENMPNIFDRLSATAETEKDTAVETAAEITEEKAAETESSTNSMDIFDDLMLDSSTYPAEDTVEDEPEATAEEQQAEEVSIEEPEIEEPTIVETSAESHVSDILSSLDDSEELDFSKFESEENSDMTPMEKMKKFAEAQIEINNSKISEIDGKKALAVSDKQRLEDEKAEIIDKNSELADKILKLKNQMEEIKAEIETLTEKKSGDDSKVSEIDNKIADQQKVIDDFDAAIAELVKSNDEFKGFFN